MAELVLETKDQENLTPTAGPVMITPPISTDYWVWRVRVGAGQAEVRELVDAARGAGGSQ